MTPPLPPAWQPILSAETTKPYWAALQAFVHQERQTFTIYPPEAEVFSALQFTPYDRVKVFLLGQDPYHDENQAHGLAFSVRPGVPPPPSLVNIFKELHSDLGLPIPNNGSLIPWAQRGVLLLNAVLTVRAHQPNSHQGKGWEQFTDAVLQAVNARSDRVVFVLWGNYARKKAPLIDTRRHVIVASAHPSPLSARRGFFGSRPFSQINAALLDAGETPIEWRLEDL